MSGRYHMKHSKKGTSACHRGSNLSSEHICALSNLVQNKIDREKEKERNVYYNVLCVGTVVLLSILFYYLMLFPLMNKKIKKNSTYSK